MKATPNALVEPFRIRTGWRGSSPGCGNNGAFRFYHGNTEITVIVSDGFGWDHISVSTPTRCPAWEEMEYVRDLFACSEEWWMQLGAPKAAHINCHPYCLHWWRPQSVEEIKRRNGPQGALDRRADQAITPPGPIPLPPAWMVGPVPGETVPQFRERLKQSIQPSDKEQK